MTKVDLKSMDREELSRFVLSLSQPKFRAKQIADFLRRGVSSFEEMHTLPAALRKILEERAFLNQLTVERKLISRLDGTVKYLFRLMDGECVETVLMRYHHGNTVCISSQVGCRMGCSFCASTIGGKVRDLTPSEMEEQVRMAALDTGERVDNVVVMGIGEPFDNFDNLLKFLYNVNDPERLGIGMRHITVSTCGVIPGIRRLMEEELQLTLAISLHAADSEQRSRIMPVNARYPLPELMDVCREYQRKTGRRMTYEFALISGVNDDSETAKRLAALLKGQLCHVNLIPVNPVKERGFSVPSAERIAQFQAVLEQHRIPATVRRTLGADINASCGQLRRQTKQRGDELAK